MLNDYIQKLKNLLHENNIADYENYIEYIEEIIGDRLDNGESEEDILNSLEDPEVILSSLKTENAPVLSSNYKEKSKVNFEDEKYYAFDDIEDIEIDVASCDIEIYLTNNIQSNVKVIGDTDESIDVQYKNHKLEIEQNNTVYNFGWPFFKVNRQTNNIKLIIELTEKQYGELELNNVSGETTLTDLSFNEVELDTVSGDISINNCKFKVSEISAVSGDIIASTFVSLRDLELNSVSGDINLKNLSSNDINVKTVSGDVSLLLEGKQEEYCIDVEKIMEEKHYDKGGSKSLQIETVSGDINYSFTY